MKEAFKKIQRFLFHNQTPGQTVIKNIIWLLTGKVGSRLLRTILVIYAARILGVTSWGVFSYATSLVGMIAILTDFGISALVTREYAQDEFRNDSQQTLSTALILKFAFLTPAIIFILFIAPHFSIAKPIPTLLIFFAVMLVFDSIRQLGFSIIKARQKMEIQALLYGITNIIIVISGLILLQFNRSITSLTYAYTLGSIIGCICTLYYLKDFITTINFSFQRSIAIKILRSAWPFAVSGLLGSILISSDIFILGFFKSAQEVGLYSAGDKIMQVLYAPSIILATSSFPVFAKFAKLYDAKISFLVKRLFFVLITIASTAALVGIFCASTIIHIIFGKSYDGATIAFQILLLTLPFRYGAILLTNIMFAHDRQKVLTAYTILSIMVNVVLDLALIPKFGLTGTAMATVTAHAIGTIYIWTCSKNTFLLSKERNT